MKATVIIEFRGADYSQLYEKGETYDFEQQRAEALAARGLVKLIEEKKETPAESAEIKQENQVKNESEAESAEVKQEETQKRGRRKATE